MSSDNQQKLECPEAVYHAALQVEFRLHQLLKNGLERFKNTSFNGIIFIDGEGHRSVQLHDSSHKLQVSLCNCGIGDEHTTFMEEIAANDDLVADIDMAWVTLRAAVEEEYSMTLLSFSIRTGTDTDCWHRVIDMRLSDDSDKITGLTIGFGSMFSNMGKRKSS